VKPKAVLSQLGTKADVADGIIDYWEKETDQWFSEEYSYEKFKSEFDEIETFLSIIKPKADKVMQLVKRASEMG